jgi:hypothetical protein
MAVIGAAPAHAAAPAVTAGKSASPAANPYSPSYKHPYRHGAVPTLSGQAKLKSFAAASGPTPGGAGSKGLSFGGGIDGIGVQTGHSKVYLVFYGTQWGSQGADANGNATFSGDPDGAAPAAQQMFKGIGTNNETWSATLTQYCEGVANGSTGCPPNAAFIPYQAGGVLAGVWYDNSAASPAQTSGHQLGQEAVNAAAHFGNTTSASNRNAYYVILSPHGTNPDNYVDQTNGFCAWHDYNGDASLTGGPVSSPYGDVAFSNQPYNMDAGATCGVGFLNTPGTLDGWTITLGHEWQEMMSDQNPAGGWTNQTGDPVYNGQENADECAWIPGGQAGGVADVAFATGSFAEQATWSNDSNSCAISHPVVYPDPTTTIPQQATFFTGLFDNEANGIGVIRGVAEIGGPSAVVRTLDTNGHAMQTFSPGQTPLQIRYGLRILSGDFNGDGRTDFVELPTATQSVVETHIPLMLQIANPDPRHGQFQEAASTEDDSAFLAEAATANVYAVVGDFNGDGKADIALLGNPAWTSVPVAYSHGDGTFTVTTMTLSDPSFQGWSYWPYGAKPFVGDFNGDGKSDIALADAGYFTTIPVAMSTGTGFTVTNTSAPGFEAQALTPGAKTIVGHFDSAHMNRAGLAVVGGNNNGDDLTIQTAFSNGDGTFNIVASDAAVDWQDAPGVQIVAGTGPHSFTYNGLTSVALTGVAGWTSVPLLIPDGAGHWTAHNDAPAPDPGVPSNVVPAYVRAAQPHATAFEEDFNMIMIGGDGWTDMPRLFSVGDGNWNYNPMAGNDEAAFERDAQYNPNYRGPIPTSAAIYFSTTANSVTLSWQGGPTSEFGPPLFFDVYKRNNGAVAGNSSSGWTLLRTYQNTPPDTAGLTYTYVDNSSNPGGDCYTVAARNNLGTGWDDALARAVCTVRSDPALFSQTVTPAVTQWQDLDARNGFTNDLLNTVRNQWLSDQNQTFGVNLDWTTNPNRSNFTVTAEPRLGANLVKGEDFALKEGPDGYLHFNGFALVSQSSPSYEWRVLGGAPDQPTVSAPGQGSPFRQLNYGVYALWNDAAQDFLVNGVNVTGGPDAAHSANLAWYKQTVFTPPPSHGIKVDKIYDCSLAQHPVEVFTQDLTAGGAFADQGQVAFSGGPAGCGFATGNPLTFNPISGHQYLIHVLDYQNPGCSTHDPNDGSCIVMQDALTGDSNGRTELSGVNLSESIS